MLDPPLVPCLKSISVQGPLYLSLIFPSPPIIIPRPWYSVIYGLFSFPFSLHILSASNPPFHLVLTLDSGAQSTVLWPSSHSTTSPPSLPSFLLRAPLHHSLQWMRSLLSPLVLLFPLFHPQQDRKTEEIQQERQRERENGWRQAERDVRIILIFCCIIEPIHTLKEQCKNQTKEANFTERHMHNRLARSFQKEDQTHFYQGWGWMYKPQRKILHNICLHFYQQEWQGLLSPL